MSWLIHPATAQAGMMQQNTRDILIAFLSRFLLLGVMYSPLLALLKIFALVLCLWRPGTEGARI